MSPTLEQSDQKISKLLWQAICITVNYGNIRSTTWWASTYSLA